MRSKPGIGVAGLVFSLIALGGCRVSTSRDGQGGDKDVDIKTPLGSISVHEGETDPKVTGLSPYPGAQLRKDMDGEGGANVNVSSSLFGVKVAVLKYRSDDPPDKVLSFYRKDMAKYGKVVDCTGGFTLGYRHHDQDAEVACDNAQTGHQYREILRVGTQNNQRDLAVRPAGSGSEFALIYVRTWDDKSTM
ncbi:MAG TPA: hypothetical protein VKW06_22825 [Candidatus Angelobacter sp.]|nr:hypothetical protein [Candidatus Angelobacter sp.]